MYPDYFVKQHYCVLSASVAMCGLFVMYRMRELLFIHKNPLRIQWFRLPTWQQYRETPFTRPEPVEKIGEGHNDKKYVSYRHRLKETRREWNAQRLNGTRVEVGEYNCR